MSAFEHAGPESSYRHPAPSEGDIDPHDELVDATDVVPGQRRVGPTLTWTDLSASEHKIRTEEFVSWFDDETSKIFLKAAHSVSGRGGDALAVDAVVKVYEQWPDARKRALFKGSPGYLYSLTRNLFLDEIRSSYRRHELSSGLPGQEDDGGLAARIWEKGELVDPGWEVRHALNALSAKQSELIFLLYWLGFSKVGAGRQMGLSRGQVERLLSSAIEELKVLLEEEG